VKAEDKINLDSSKNIILESGQSQNKADGKNSNAGLSVGVGVSVGAQTGAYIYGEAGFGKGSNHLDSNTHDQTTLDAKNISLTSKGDTILLEHRQKQIVLMQMSVVSLKLKVYKTQLSKIPNKMEREAACKLWVILVVAKLRMIRIA